MRSYDKYRDTKFVQKTDVEKEVLVTIDKVTEEDVSMEDKPEKMKFVIYFKEDYKPWAPGIESLEDIHRIAGTGNVDDWHGTKLVLLVDPDVRFAGKKVGGIRCRAPKNQQPPPTIEEQRQRLAEAEKAEAEKSKTSPDDDTDEYGNPIPF